MSDTISNDYRNYLKTIAAEDAEVVLKKDLEYGASWKRRGGIGAAMMMLRKIDRIEEQIKKVNWDIFKAVDEDTRTEGILDDLDDLARYLLLIRSEIKAVNKNRP